MNPGDAPQYSDERQMFDAEMDKWRDHPEMGKWRRELGIEIVDRLAALPEARLIVREWSKVNGESWIIRGRRPKQVIWSIEWHEPAHAGDAAQPWLHLSMSRPVMPEYEDMVWLHRVFAGQRLAYQMFLPPEEHVNEHPRCLHLWVPLGYRVTPPFHVVVGDTNRL